MSDVDEARTRRDGGDHTFHRTDIVVAITEVGEQRDGR